MIYAFLTAAMFTLNTAAHRSMDITMGCIMESREMESLNQDPHYILDHDQQYRIVTDEEFLLICKCVQTEARGESNICQECIATVILNRWLNPEKYPDTIAGVIYDPGQFAINESIYKPDVGVRLAVRNAIVYYNTYQMLIPYQTYWFRANHYHENLGMPYINIDNTYFSVDEHAVID